MDFSSILNLVIGIIFIYFLVALACSTVQEIIANALNMRAENLEKWLKDTFRENNLGEKILAHRLVDGLTAAGRKASYIPSRIFSDTLLDLVNNSDKPYTLESLKEAVEKSDLPQDFKRRLNQSISESWGGMESVRQDIETWFDSAMERISGTYKKKAHFFLGIASVAIVLIFKIDSVEIARYLYDHPEKSAALADQVAGTIQDLDQRRISISPDSTSIDQAIKANIQELKLIQADLESTQLPFGWESKSTSESFLTTALGLLLTMMAGFVGAPFWFDVLNKLVNLRGSGIKP
jgi:uncharacterized protein YktB (UPF0637 family)